MESFDRSQAIHSFLTETVRPVKFFISLRGKGKKVEKSPFLFEFFVIEYVLSQNLTINLLAGCRWLSKNISAWKANSPI